MEIYKRLYVKNKAKLGDFIEVETLNEKPTIEQPQMKAEGLHNLIEQTRVRAKGAYH